MDITNSAGVVLLSVADTSLYEANLSRANLSEADLCGADLRGATLREANLSGATLRGANLSGANLSRATLSEADLRGANLYGANLYGATLSEADLRGANLRGADLRRAQHVPPLIAAQLSILPSGTVIGWKKCCDGVLVRLSIPAGARRSNATGRKCRAEWVEVLDVIGSQHAGQAWSLYRRDFVYRVGERVACDHWEEDRWVECGGGIHFYLTREEAEAHG